MSAIRSVVSGVAGLFLAVLGGVGVVKAGATGLEEHVAALRFHQTGLFGWIQLVLGLLLIASAVSSFAGGTAGFLGLLAAVFGLVVLFTGDSLHETLGVHRENGILYLVIGGVVALAGFLGRSEEDRVVDQRVV